MCTVAQYFCQQWGLLKTQVICSSGHPKELCNPVGQEGVTCCCSPAAGTGTSNPSGSTTGADLGEPIGIITIEDVLEELLQQVSLLALLCSSLK